MANVWEKSISILSENFNSGLRYLITTVLCTMTNSHLDMQGLKTIIPMQPKQLFQKAENAPQLVPLLFFKLENNNHHSMTTRLSQIECQNNFFCLYVRYGQQQTDTKHNLCHCAFRKALHKSWVFRMRLKGRFQSMISFNLRSFK